MGGACGTMGENRNAYRVLVRKPECERLHGRHGDAIKGILKIMKRWLGLD
jgi:predicted RNA-binding protein YlqC (UPF0109 family)